MRGERIRNFLAAFGAVFFIIIALSVIIAVFIGRKGISGADKVAVVELTGVITDPTEFGQELEAIEERDDIKAVVVRIDSPGGAVAPSQEIHSRILRLKEVKTVVASMGTIAASGGLYSAVAAEKIVANPGTITGSIGVIVEFMNAEELLGKIGLKGKDM
ncbi:MAG: S49 family peptidase [Deltaproteobacteria bacterium]|nr:S49 family peptidase [Deltaproteobacteria bacterium]